MCYYGTPERRYFGNAFIATDIVFHSRGPVTEKAFFPNLVLVRGMSNSLLFADRSLPRPEIVDFLVVVSAM